MSSHPVTNQVNLVAGNVVAAKTPRGQQELSPALPASSITQSTTTSTTTTNAAQPQQQQQQQQQQPQQQPLLQTPNPFDPSSTIVSSTTTTPGPGTSSTAMNGTPTSVSEMRTPNLGNHHHHHHLHHNNNNNHSHHGHHQQQNLSKTNLYIKGLQNNTSDQDLYNMCSRFGPILSTKAIMDKATGTCKGYGFVEFTSPQTAELAVHELTSSGVLAQMAKISTIYSSNNHNHHHHHNYNHNHNNSNNNNHHHGNNNNNNSSIHHQPGNNNAMSHTNNNNVNSNQQQHYQGSNNNADPTNLYIANLPPNITEQELENLLSKYGSVVSTRILRDQSNNTRGVGFARMDSRDKCEQIIEQLNGRSYKGWKEPLLVKFADGNKKRHHQHSNHHHQHHNNSHHQHHKAHQDDGRWQDNGGGNTNDPGNTTSFEHQSNIAHSNRLSDLTMMSTMSYPRMQPGFPPNVAPGGPYQTSLGPQTSPPQWIHHGGPGQPPFVISQQMIQAGGMGPSNQAAAAALHYGHIPQLTSQMQGLQITHPGGPVGAGYLPPQHQWSTLWAHPIPQQAQPSLRLPAHHMQPAPQQHQQQQQQAQTQQSPQITPIQSQQQPNPPQPPSINDNSSNKLQVSIPL